MLWPEKTPLWWRPLGVSVGDSRKLLGDVVWTQRITKGLRHASQCWGEKGGSSVDLKWLPGHKNWECLYALCQAWDCEAAGLKVSLVPTKLLCVVGNKRPQNKWKTHDCSLEGAKEIDHSGYSEGCQSLEDKVEGNACACSQIQNE